MRRPILGVGVLLAGIAGCLHAPMPWSPDGAWIAYPVATRRAESIIAPGWLFETGEPSGKYTPAPPTGYRLWATQGFSGASVLLDESAGPITAPGWSPDGRSLAFGRVLTVPGQASRFEVVILEGMGRRRTLSTRPFAALDGEACRLPYQAIAWSPDGRYLAVPQFDPNGLAILRADNGRVVNTIPDAFLPSWSPGGGRLAFYLRSGGHALHYVDSALGQPRHLIDVGQASQAPAWTRDGASIITLARRTQARPVGEAGTDQLDLIRVRLEGGGVELVRSLSTDGGSMRERAVEAASITSDRDGENIFLATEVEGAPHQVTWFHPRDNAVYRKFHPADYSIPVGSLALTPDGQTLAARVGGPDQLSAPLLCDLASGEPKTRLIAPDDSTRLEWIEILTRTARTILAKVARPRVRVAGEPLALDRPTILPLASELVHDQESLGRLRRIGRLGRPLCDRPAEAADASPAVRQVIDEARLFFDYLREDYPAALGDLERLERAADAPDRRLAMLGLRAQILVNQGRIGPARRIITYLDRLEGDAPRRVEWAGGRYELTPEARPDRGWPRFLAEAAAKPPAPADDAGRVGPRVNPMPMRNPPLFEPEPPPQFRLAPPFQLPIEPPFPPRRPSPPPPQSLPR